MVDVKFLFRKSVRRFIAGSSQSALLRAPSLVPAVEGSLLILLQQSYATLNHWESQSLAHITPLCFVESSHLPTSQWNRLLAVYFGVDCFYPCIASFRVALHPNACFKVRRKSILSLWLVPESFSILLTIKSLHASCVFALSLYNTNIILIAKLNLVSSFKASHRHPASVKSVSAFI